MEMEREIVWAGPLQTPTTPGWRWTEMQMEISITDLSSSATTQNNRLPQTKTDFSRLLNSINRRTAETLTGLSTVKTRSSVNYVCGRIAIKMDSLIPGNCIRFCHGMLRR